MRSGGGWEVVAAEVPGIGRVAFVLPRLRDDYPDELKQALTRRRMATVSGRCECGATRPRLNRAQRRAGHVVPLEMVHEDDCPAANTNIIEIGWRHGIRLAG